MASVEQLRGALHKLGQELREQRGMIVSTRSDYLQAGVHIQHTYDLPANQDKHPHAWDARMDVVNTHFKLDRVVECIDHVLKFIDQYHKDI